MVEQREATGQWYSVCDEWFFAYILHTLNSDMVFLQIDALGPAVDILVKDMPTARGDQALEVLQSAVEVVLHKINMCLSVH